MFFCDKCGLCCKSIGGIEMLKAFDRGDGVCKYLDTESMLCTIYNQRPLICRVDESYEVFFSHCMTKREYLELNHESCKKLKEIHSENK